MAAQNTTGSVPYFLFYSLLTHFGTKHVNMCCVVKHTLKFLLIRPAFSHDVVHTLSVIIMQMYLFFTSSILLSLSNKHQTFLCIPYKMACCHWLVQYASCCALCMYAIWHKCCSSSSLRFYVHIHVLHHFKLNTWYTCPLHR